MKDRLEQSFDKKQKAAENIWLHYYNEVLFARGINSENERNRMANRIDALHGISP